MFTFTGTKKELNQLQYLFERDEWKSLFLTNTMDATDLTPVDTVASKSVPNCHVHGKDNTKEKCV